MILFDRNLKIVVNTNTKKYTFTDLYMDFNCDADRDRKPNNGTFTIYNLSKATREAFTTDYRSIELYAGYGTEEPPLVFVGSIISILNEKQGVNFATTIQALDGGEKYFDIIYNKSFAKGTPVEAVLLDIIKSMGLIFENSAFITEVLLSGITYTGRVKDVLSQICDDFDLKWSIQREVVQVVNKGEAPISSLTSAILLGPDTGMIESPVTREDGSIVVKSLMNPEIRPNRIVKLMPVNPTSFVGFKMVKAKLGKAFDVVSQGFFIIDKARYTGSNYGSSYQVELECVKK